MLKRMSALIATLGLLVTLTAMPSFAQDKMKDDQKKDDKMAQKDKMKDDKMSDQDKMKDDKVSDKVKTGKKNKKRKSKSADKMKDDKMKKPAA